MKEVLDQESKLVRQSTTETTTVEGNNTPTTAPKPPTASQNTEDIKLLAPPGLSTEKKRKDILNSQGQLTKELKDDADSSTDLICLDSIERLNREVLRFKNVLDNMWLKNTDFVYTKENFKRKES
ncbi:MAG: hypothetical protein ACE5GU_09270 [Candidatus Scalinduaceae bacterium]